jgi:hypothetical protein
MMRTPKARPEVVEEPSVSPSSEGIQEVAPEISHEKISNASSAVPMKFRKKEANKPMYLMRYE